MNATPGTRIFNHGDMANPEHFGTITAVVTDRWGTHITIRPDAEAEREPYTVSLGMLSNEYKGHGGTRIVPLTAYEAWRAKQIEELTRHCKETPDHDKA